MLVIFLREREEKRSRQSRDPEVEFKYVLLFDHHLPPHPPPCILMR
jgi:hypothetical protein